MGLDLRVQIGDIDVAVLIAANCHDFETHHDGTGRIRPVRRGGNETNRAIHFSTTFVIASDG